ncbi:bacterial proteasome activator family protein [Pseudarthrobacter sp. Fe7]|nr:bacterial proteasome activator family protein [Pseudarthrobacter sp. Fe7]UUL76380.1 bacterial proteasome activator family protein [Pseudarthrobacter sp. Fe7]
MSEPNDTQAAEDLPVEGTPVDDSEAPVQSPSDGGGRPRGSNLQDLVDEPAKVMRIGTMIRQLLEEVKSAPLDDAARGRLAAIHERSIKELEDGLAPELVAEPGQDQPAILRRGNTLRRRAPDRPGPGSWAGLRACSTGSRRPLLHRTQPANTQPHSCICASCRRAP